MCKSWLRSCCAVVPLGLALLGVVAAGCSSPAANAGVVEGGQTGSAGCSVSPKCICDSAAQLVFARGVFHPVDDMSADVELLEVYESGAAPAAGATVSGPYQVGFPCGLGTLPLLQEGAEVLIGYTPRQEAQAPGTSLIVEWQSTLRLTPEFELPADEVRVLEDPGACAQRFPDKEPICPQNF